MAVDAGAMAACPFSCWCREVVVRACEACVKDSHCFLLQHSQRQKQKQNRVESPLSSSSRWEEWADWDCLAARLHLQ